MINVQFFRISQENCAHENPTKHRQREQKITGLDYFCVYKQAVSASYFILYPLFILLSHYLKQLPKIELYHPGRWEVGTQLGLRIIPPLFCHWSSSTDHRAPQRHICHHHTCLPDAASNKGLSPTPLLSILWQLIVIVRRRRRRW